MSEMDPTFDAAAYARKIAGGGSPTKRRNAGGIKSGLPLIITGGMERHREFQYLFTDPGKFKKKNPKDGVDLSVIKTRQMKDVAEKLKYLLPIHYCPDCDSNMIVREKAKVLGMWAVAEPHPEVHLVPGEVIIHIKCQDCIDHELWGRKNLLITGDDEFDEYRLRMVTQNRMERNLVSYVRNRLMANDTSIIVDEETRKRFGGLC